ncbi:single-stranded DNA-binding protein [Salmonella enterica subsp. enterica]|nr:single-stranded DNA-binding protein [Salmonella enterica subsp. enterica]MIF51093.1 single-stranded DNA-binding protein [Salmonella enterica subsp. enterica]
MAQRGLNKLCLIGYLGQNPEIRYTQDKQPITVFSIATTETWKNRETGEVKERAQWHRIVVYNKLAEIAAEYLKKGNQVYIEGRLRTRRWTDNLGAERLAVDVIVDMNGMLQILGSRPETETGDNNETPPPQNDNSPQQELPEIPEAAPQKNGRRKKKE